MPQMPQVLTLLMADVVSRDPITRKFSILGTYNAITMGSFPAVLPSMSLYLALTDGRGKMPLLLRLIDADEERPPVFTIATILDSSDPTLPMEAGLCRQRLLFPKPGEYRLQLFAAGEPLLEGRLFVMAGQPALHSPVSPTL